MVFIKTIIDLFLYLFYFAANCDIFYSHHREINSLWKDKCHILMKASLWFGGEVVLRRKQTGVHLDISHSSQPQCKLPQSLNIGETALKIPS